MKLFKALAYIAVGAAAVFATGPAGLGLWGSRPPGGAGAAGVAGAGAGFGRYLWRCWCCWRRRRCWCWLGLWRATFGAASIIPAATIATGSGIMAGGAAVSFQVRSVKAVAGSVISNVGQALMAPDPNEQYKQARKLRQEERDSTQKNYLLPGYDYTEKKWK